MKKARRIGFTRGCGFFLFLAASPLAFAGQPPSPSFVPVEHASPIHPVGAAAYSAVGPEPRTHRVVDGDERVFQVIVIELRRSEPLGDDIPSRDAARRYVQILDNPRMRAWRLILEPGQSVPPPLHAAAWGPRRAAAP